MAEKNLVEEALLQMENLQEAITNNAKGILASTMKEEISELVKESLVEPEGDAEVEMSETEVSEQEEVLDLDVDVEDEDEGEEEGLELDLDDTLSDNEDDEESEVGDDEMLMTDLPGDDLEVDDEEEVLLPLDLTAASDDEILKVFKAMGEDDGIIVKQDGDDIHLSDDETDAEYVIQLGESEQEEDVMYEIDLDEEMQADFNEGIKADFDEEMQADFNEGVKADFDEGMQADFNEGMKADFDEEETLYEIDLGEEEASEEWGGKKGDDSKSHKDYETNEEEDEEEEGEREETQAHSNNIGRRQIVKPSNYPKNLERPAVRESVKNEIKQLREKNEEYRKALNIFKEKLNEVAVFNSNLAYATRLFTEHSTTKQEKINILRRFDGVETLKESKSLYKTIKEDLGGKEQNVVTESVQAKVTKTPTKGSANNLIESKTYENPQFLRMKDLMGKIK
jgi:hypothetical protein